MTYVHVRDSVRHWRDGVWEVVVAVVEEGVEVGQDGGVGVLVVSWGEGCWFGRACCSFGNGFRGLDG